MRHKNVHFSQLRIPRLSFDEIIMPNTQVEPIWSFTTPPQYLRETLLFRERSSRFKQRVFKQIILHLMVGLVYEYRDRRVLVVIKL